MIILISFLILLTLSEKIYAGNPGLLISLPFPINLPSIVLPLPIKMDNIVISNLELTNTYLQTLDYDWTFDIKNASVTVSSAFINFNWTYKGDSGFGTFTEEGLELDFYYTFTSSSTHHFNINVTSTKIRPGHSKVSLGGKVPEIIAVQVTNLILNHASILFRGFISKQLTKTITDMSSIIGQDKHLYSDKPSGKQFYLNTTLVAVPIISGQNLIAQLNGAIYVKGESSGELNPSQILIRTNSSEIQVHIHKNIVSSFIYQLLKARGGDISLTLHTLDITSIINVDSLLVSPVFPPMAFFKDERDVIFNLKVPKIDFLLTNSSLRFEFPLFTNVYTYNTIEKRNELYIERIDGKMSLEIEPIFGKVRNSIRISQIEVLDFQPNPVDIDEGRMIPEAIQPYFGFLVDWIGDAINLQLNRKVVSLTYKNILAVLSGQIIKNMDLYLEINLKNLNSLQS